MPELSKILRFLMVISAVLTLACGGSGESTSEAPVPATAPSPDTPAPAAVTEPLGSSSVSGSVVFDGDVPRLRPLDMNADPGCAEKHDGPVANEQLVLGDGNALANVFVQVKNAPEGSGPAPAEPVVIDQNGCLYEPRVVGVRVGQPIKFKNSDGILHNVHGRPTANREFNIGMPPTLLEQEQTFNTPEPLFPVKCDVHPWMQSYVAVMTHPFFAVTDTSGRFSIEGLPAGTYEIEAWHEKLGTRTASVTVGDGEAGSTDFSFSVPSGG